MPFCAGYSSHCPLSFSLRLPTRKPAAPFPTKALLHDDFAKVAEAHFYDLVRRLPPSDTATCLQRLVLVKRAFISAAARIIERPAQPCAVSIEDRLSVTMAFILAAERKDMVRARDLAGQYQHIPDTFGEALTSDDIRGHGGVGVLKQHVIRLPHALQQETATLLLERRHDMGELLFHNAMKTSRRRIQRLKPDVVIALNAVANIDRSDDTTLPTEMAERFCSHWSIVFADKSVDGDLLDRWLDEEFPTTRPNVTFSRALPTAVGNYMWSILKRLFDCLVTPLRALMAFRIAPGDYVGNGPQRFFTMQAWLCNKATRCPI